MQGGQPVDPLDHLTVSEHNISNSPKFVTHPKHMEQGFKVAGDEGGAILYTQQRRCSECHKVFYATGSWVYKRYKKIFCGYTCMRRHDRRCVNTTAEPKKE